MKNLVSGVVFPVADVDPAMTPLRESEAREVLGRLVSTAHLLLVLAQQFPPSLLQDRKRLDRQLQKTPIPGELVSCSHDGIRLVSSIAHHPVILALRLAYAQHRPIALSPDIVWLLISQGVAQHINLNAEELRPRFVYHQGKKTVSVETIKPHFDDLEKLELDWKSIVDKFSEQVRGLTTPKAHAFAADFSTTGPKEKIASTIVLLGALQQYFHYDFDVYICGIPQIKLEGTESDWVSIIDRTEAFDGIGLDWWLKPLRSILGRFPAAFHGEVAPEFWRSIYRICSSEGACGYEPAVGWISVFFPYLIDRNGKIRVKNPWFEGTNGLNELLDPGDQDRVSGAFQGIYDDDLPFGITKAPFVLNIKDPDGITIQSEGMDFLGGFIGVSQDPETLFIRPEIGWGVRRSNIPVSPN